MPKKCRMCRAKVALRTERDWLCKDRLLEGYIKMGIVSKTHCSCQFRENLCLVCWLSVPFRRKVWFWLNGFRAVAFHDPYLPSVLCELLLDKQNSGKMCNKVSCLELDELICIHIFFFTAASAKIDLFVCALGHRWRHVFWMWRKLWETTTWGKEKSESFRTNGSTCLFPMK